MVINHSKPQPAAKSNAWMIVFPVTYHAYIPPTGQNQLTFVCAAVIDDKHVPDILTDPVQHSGQILLLVLYRYCQQNFFIG
jgi:hypothetical protein